MILCVNANPAIDKTVVISPFRLNAIHRPQQVMALPGGKGCNVARALKRLGETPVVSGWVGGFAGQFIEAGLEREGIQTDFIHNEAESRTCLSILDSEANSLTEIYENGEVVPPEKICELKECFRATVGNYAAITLSGSLPPGVRAEYYSDLIEIAHAAQVPVLLDASGAALSRNITARPFVVKPNKQEIAVLRETAADMVADDVQLVAALARRFGTWIVLSLGADGALASDGQEVLHARPPQLTIKSAVGSGDSMLAGITYGLAHDFSFEEMIKYGVAAGTANALTFGAGIFTTEAFEQVHAKVTVVRP